MRNAPGTQQNAYALLGFKVAYGHDAHWSGYMQADNLTDKAYASSYAIRNAGHARRTDLPARQRAFLQRGGRLPVLGDGTPGPA